MQKEEILITLQNYLNSKKLLEIKKYNDFALFVKAVSKNELHQQEILYILDQNKKFIFSEHKNLTLLHYACLSNNPQIVQTILSYSIKNGLTQLPLLSIEFFNNNKTKYCPENTSLFSFCSILDLNLSYAKILQFVSDFENINLLTHVDRGLFNNSYSIIPIVKSIVGEETLQNFLLDFFINNQPIFHKKLENHHYNLAKLNPYIDFEFGKNKTTNYSHLLFQSLQSLDFNNGAHFYLPKIYSTIHFFIKKKFDFYQKDHLGKSALDYFDSFKQKFETFCKNQPFFSQSNKNLAEQKIIEIQNMIIQSSISKQKQVTTQKLKI
jgi:hypothetical protein